MEVRAANGRHAIRGRDFPVNKGALCIKGWTAGEALEAAGRLRSPLARSAAGALAPVSWTEAAGLFARRVEDIQREYGPEAVGVLGGGSLTNEKAYLLGKFARVALGTSKIDYNGRFCMSSAAAAATRAFGIDRGLPFPLSDIARAEVVLLVGSNVAETMPPFMQYFEAQRRNGGKLVVIDPRRTPTAEAAALHLRGIPGTDLALAHGLLHLLIRNGAIDNEYIERRTTGFDRVRSLVAAYWPERVERITGIPETQLVRTADLLGAARTLLVLTGRGADQQCQGVNNTLGFINIALATGQVGRPYGGWGCLTGQGNGQGGREHGQKADQLPGYRSVVEPLDRRHVAEVWGVPESSLPGMGVSAYEMMETAGTAGGIRALFVNGTNPLVSAPNGGAIGERLRSLDFLAVTDFFLSETASIADLVLPSTQWAEETGTMTNLEGRVILREQAVSPPPGVMSDIDLLVLLAGRLGKGEYFRFEGPQAVFDELRRATAGGIADYSGISYDKIRANSGVFWPCPSPEHPGTPRLFATGSVDGDRFAPPPGFFTSDGRARFHDAGHRDPGEVPDSAYPVYLTTGRVMAHYQSGTQTRRIGRLVEMASEPLLEIHPRLALRHKIADGDRVSVTTRRGEASFRVRFAPGMREDTVFAPFHWGGRQSANRLTNPALDEISRMPEFKVCAARLERVPEEITDGK
jgi:assimilatory nitrate reductase catalytic subunit